MELGNYSLQIVKPNTGLREIISFYPEENGYVSVPNNSFYEILITNGDNLTISADIEIDGKPIGVFKIERNDYLKLDTVPGSGKKLKFFAMGSKEFSEIADTVFDKNLLGLIKVTIKKEKVTMIAQSFKAGRSIDNYSTGVTRSLGGSGLSGTSNQKFQTTEFETDESEIYELYLRLIPSKEPKVISSGIPKPIW